MRYPNLRYGNPNQLAFYAQGIPVKDLAKRLRRSERSVKDWLDGKKKVPWWVPEIVRFQHIEHYERLRQMGMTSQRGKLGLVSADVIDFPARPILQDELVVDTDPYTLPLFNCA